MTYALALPASHPLARRPADLYRAVHGAIAGALRELGVEATRRGGVESGGMRPFLCFTGRDPEDIVIGGAKVVGSAQRRRAGAVLQHGSLLLARAAATPELPGLAELAGDWVADALWPDRLAACIPVALGLTPLSGGEPQGLRERAGVLERETYRDPSWGLRR